MVDAGPYVLGILALALLALAVGFAAVRLRRGLLPAWQGAPARLVEAILAIALLVWLTEALGLFGLLYAWTLVFSALLLAAMIAWLTPGPLPGDRTHGPELLASLAAIAVAALVFAHWGLTAADALGRGIFNFDSLWYHMPFAAEFAKTHSVTGLHYTETVFANWFYPQSSELLHSVGILLTGRDTLSLFLNFGFLAIALLAAWCIGRPYGLGPLTVTAAAIVLASHTLVVREPGAAKNDAMAAALLLAAIAILVTAGAEGLRRPRGQQDEGRSGPRVLSRGGGSSPLPGTAAAEDPLPTPPAGGVSLPIGWALAVAGLAVGLAAGTKFTVLAMAAALTVAVLALAPRGRRQAAAAWWFLPALAGGGFWYARNLVVAGNPIPQIESLGPISLPHPESLQSGRPDFSVAHYATDTGVWADYFAPGLEHAFGALWPLVVGGAAAGAVLAAASAAPFPGMGRKRRTGADPEPRHPDRVIRWMGGVALFGMVAYLFTPLSAAGAEGAPEAFRINLRFAVPALLLGLTLLPVAVARGRGVWPALAALVAILAITDRSDAVLRDPDRLAAWLIALLFVLLPAALVLARRRGAPRAAVAAGFAALALAVAAIGYPVQRDYLEDRFAPGSGIPGMSLDSAYHWARDVSDARIGLAGTTAGFLQYGLYGTDLSNEVRYIGEEGPLGAFDAIPACGGFRAAVNAADLDYLVTTPFLNFIDPDEPVASPEAGWLRGAAAVAAVDRSGPVTVWRVRGRLDPDGCDPANAPLRHVPSQPVD